MHRDTGRVTGKSLAVAAAALALAGVAVAQATPRFGIGIRLPGMPVEVAQLPQAPPAPQQFATGFAGPEVMAVRPFRFRVVTGAPFEATATAVTTERLADGNQITRTSVFRVARDQQGRMRRVVRLGGIGPWLAHGDMVFITDPVAHRRYVVNPQRKTFALLPYRGRGGASARRPLWRSAERGQRWTVVKQSLGHREMDGVRVIGRRTITTIPAGAIGNQAPIRIVSERWYSPALHTVVEATHDDPRFGDTVYRLGQIRRTDPPASLFAPPPGFTELRVRRFHPRGSHP